MNPGTQAVEIGNMPHISKKEKTTCKICGKIWLDYPSNNKRVKNRFCSFKCLSKSMKGKPTWNKGKKDLPKLSKKTRLKQSKSHKKRVKLGLNNFWRGGLTSKNHKIRHNIELKLWRTSVFERDNYTCQNCKIRGGRLEAHHIKSFAKFLELRTSIENGMTLCRECHKLTDNYGNKQK